MAADAPLWHDDAVIARGLLQVAYWLVVPLLAVVGRTGALALDLDARSRPTWVKRRAAHRAIAELHDPS